MPGPGLSRRGSVVAAIALTALTAASAEARTYRVTRRSDPHPGACRKHDCSLREAILAANRHSGADVVLLPNRRRDYRLQIPGLDSHSGDLNPKGPVTIKHAGMGKATVDARSIDRIFATDKDAGRVRLSRLVITGGFNTDGYAGAVFGNAGTRLTLVDCRVTHSETDEMFGKYNAYGGGIAAYGTLHLIRTTVAHNKAGGAPTGFGGGIYLGHFTNYASSATLERSRIFSNRVPYTGEGGGVDASDQAGPVKITRTTISGNHAGTGGGIGVGAGGAAVRGSTISGNHAEYAGGGASDLAGTLRLTNSTIYGNDAGSNGGGIFASGGRAIINAGTLASNIAAHGGGPGAGGGIFASADTVRLANSILAHNRLGSGGPSECETDLLTSDHNLLASPNAGCLGYAGNGTRVSSAPKLGSLASHGGATPTVALLRHSPAINRANPASAPKADQRGHRRHDPDIGAFER